MRKRRNRAFWIAGIVLLVLLAQFAFFQPVRDFGRRIISVPISFADSIGGGFYNSIRLLGSINELAAENARLREENLEKTAQIAQLETIRGENESLRKDLGFSETRPDLAMLPADIINYSPSGSQQSVVINRGSSDGVAAGQAVVSSGYLLGKIERVDEHTSEIYLLNNRNLLTPVLLTESQTSGILKGGIRGLVVENIPVDTQVVTGENVATTALENVYPAGIAVGRVEEVISRKEEIFVTVRISSPINIANIRTVFVVTDS
jgi:rod shape-determining protein MreC